MRFFVTCVLLVTAGVSASLGCSGNPLFQDGVTGTGVEELAIAPLSVSRADAQAKGSISFEDAIRPQQTVFRSQVEWTAFWRQHGEESPPIVDFGRLSVAAVFLGPVTPGHEVVIRRATYDPSNRRTTVLVTEIVPASGGPSISIDVYPSAIVTFPGRPGDVVFEHTRTPGR